MKRAISLILSIVMILSITAGIDLSAYASDSVLSGSCGSNGSNIATWNLDKETGVLTISGNGHMDNYRPVYYAEYAPWYNYREKINSVIIEDGIKSIGNYAFYHCSNIVNITISNSITSIGFYAFDECSSLANVTIPNSVISIYDDAFKNCKNLKSIEIPDSVTHIGEYAFSGCSSCTHVTIGNSVASIGKYAFDVCNSLIDITVNEDNTYYTSANGVLFNKKKTTLIKYPSANTRTAYAIPENVISIDKAAFYNCGGLENIIIPNSVTNIGNNAFYDCDHLVNVVMSDGVTSIESGTFYNCSALEKMEIPSEITNIGSYAFYNCSSLKIETIPNSTTNIGNYAFYNCRKLEITRIPNGIISIGDYTFYKCQNIRNITIPDSVTNIGKWAFGYCSNLNSLITSDGITDIGDYAFYDCGSLINITIPSSVTSIGKYAFYGCKNIISIAVPKGVTNIGDYTFNSCSSLENITIPEGVANIGVKAFDECRNLVSVTIPDSVINIGDEAFRHCTGLVDITVGENNKNYSSKEGVLYNKNKTKLIQYPASNTKSLYVIPNSITNIDEGAFYKCQNLTSITIPSSITSIGDYAFCECSNLTSIIIPDTVTNIGNSTFSRCSSLTSVIMSNSITSIGSSTFEDCISLINIMIPEGITSIGYAAFQNCKSLTNIVIPEGVTNIGSRAFYWCRSLASITIPNSLANIGELAFDNCNTYNVLGKVIYNGTHSKWQAINIGNSNTSLTHAKIDMLDDDHAIVVDEKKSASCTKTGLTEGSHCSVCNNVIQQQEKTPATGHFYNEGIITKNSTCVSNGAKKYTCIVCGNSYTENLPITGHKYKTTVTQATANSQGYTTYTCSVCGDIYNADYFDAATVYSDCNSATAGSTIRVPVSIKNNTGILGWKLTFDYDTDVLTPISVDYGDVISGGIQDNIEGDMVPGSINVYWAGSGNENYNGVMIYINFAVNPSAVGNTKIDISYSQEDTFDDDFNDVYFDCQPININITNNNYAQFAKINASATDVIAGDDVQLKLNISEISKVSKANVTVDYNTDNFEYKTATVNGVTLKDTNVNGKITLDISEITPSIDNTDFVILKFKAKDKAMSGKYDFTISSSDEGIICKGCSVSIKPSATSEIAEIYADDIIANYNDEIAIPVYIENNHGVMGYRLDFKYDSALLQPISVICPKEFGNNGQFNDSIGVKDGEFKVLWNNIDEKLGNGILLTLTFKVLTKEKANTVISMAYSQPDTFNEKYEDVVFNCNDINVSLNAHQHSYTTVVTEPTCTENGYTTYTCSCGESYVDDYTNASGHSYGQWTYNGDAVYNSSSDYKNGTQTRTCSVCGDEETVEALNTALLRRRGTSLTLESSILMNVMVGKKEIDYFDEVYIEATRSTTEGELVETISDFYIYNNSYYKFIYHGVTPQGLNDDIKFVVFGVKDGVKYWGPEYHYSVATYIKNTFASTKSDNLKTLLADLVYYGYQYQLYTNYNLDEPLTDILTKEQLDYKTKNDISLTSINNSSYETINNPTVNTGASLRIDSKVSVIITLAKTDSSVDLYRTKVKVVKNNGKAEYYSYQDNPEMFAQNGNYLNFYYDGVEAKEAGVPLDFTVVDEKNNPISNTRRYSIESYCQKQLSSATTSSNQKLQNLCDALMRYCKSAEKYFANPNV